MLCNEIKHEIISLILILNKNRGQNIYINV
jgi:hypothetical protein